MTYDATDADADGVVEADVDNESTTTDQADIGKVGWVLGSDTAYSELLYVEEDTDETGSVDIDTGTLADYHEYVLGAFIGGHGGGAAGTVSITLSGLTTSQYDQNEIDSGTVTESLSQNAFTSDMFDQLGILYRWSIRGQYPAAVNPQGERRPSIIQLSGGDQAESNLMNGTLRNNTQVDSIQITTGFNARALVAVKGVDYR